MSRPCPRLKNVVASLWRIIFSRSSSENAFPRQNVRVEDIAGNCCTGTVSDRTMSPSKKNISVFSIILFGARACFHAPPRIVHRLLRPARFAARHLRRAAAAILERASGDMQRRTSRTFVSRFGEPFRMASTSPLSLSILSLMFAARRSADAVGVIIIFLFGVAECHSLENSIPRV